MRKAPAYGTWNSRVTGSSGPSGHRPGARWRNRRGGADPGTAHRRCRLLGTAASVVGLVEHGRHVLVCGHVVHEASVRVVGDGRDLQALATPFGQALLAQVRRATVAGGRHDRARSHEERQQLPRGVVDEGLGLFAQCGVARHVRVAADGQRAVEGTGQSGHVVPVVLPARCPAPAGRAAAEPPSHTADPWSARRTRHRSDPPRRSRVRRPRCWSPCRRSPVQKPRRREGRRTRRPPPAPCPGGTGPRARAAPWPR